MNKDTITASIIGFSLGLIAAIIIWVLPKVFPKNTPTQPKTTQTIESPAPNENLSVEINDIKDGDVVKNKILKITGKTSNAIILAVTTPSENQIIKPENNQFEANLNLNLGGNQIVVAAYDKNNQESIKNLFIYYFEDQI